MKNKKIINIYDYLLKENSDYDDFDDSLFDEADDEESQKQEEKIEDKTEDKSSTEEDNYDYDDFDDSMFDEADDEKSQKQEEQEENTDNEIENKQTDSEEEDVYDSDFDDSIFDQTTEEKPKQDVDKNNEEIKETAQDTNYVRGLVDQNAEEYKFSFDSFSFFVTYEGDNEVSEVKPTYIKPTGEFVWYPKRAIKDLTGMFKNNKTLLKVNVSLFTKDLESMKDMFSGCENLEEAIVADMPISNLQTTEGMFAGCKNLRVVIFDPKSDSNQLKTTRSMFSGCKNLIGIDLKKFSFNNVIDITNMFNGCVELENLRLPILIHPEKISKSNGAFNGTSLGKNKIKAFLGDKIQQ